VSVPHHQVGSTQKKKIMKTRNTTTKLIALAIALSISAICTFPRASRAAVVRDTNSSVGRHSRDVRALTPQKANPCAPRGFQPFTNQNLLQNFSFNTVGPLGTSTTFSGPLPNVPPSSAAKFWTVHNSNGGAVITTQMIPSTGPMGPRMLRIRTGGNEGGVVQFFAPPNGGPLKIIASAWVYVIKGQVQLVTGGDDGYTGSAFNTTTNKWELLQICTDGEKRNSFVEILNQDVNGGAFLVDAASVVKVP
jgi:hypothetical protein